MRLWTCLGTLLYLCIILVMPVKNQRFTHTHARTHNHRLGGGAKYIKNDETYDFCNVMLFLYLRDLWSVQNVIGPITCTEYIADLCFCQSNPSAHLWTPRAQDSKNYLRAVTARGRVITIIIIESLVCREPHAVESSRRRDDGSTWIFNIVSYCTLTRERPYSTGIIVFSFFYVWFLNIIIVRENHVGCSFWTVFFCF